MSYENKNPETHFFFILVVTKKIFHVSTKRPNANVFLLSKKSRKKKKKINPNYWMYFPFFTFLLHFLEMKYWFRCAVFFLDSSFQNLWWAETIFDFGFSSALNASRSLMFRKYSTSLFGFYFFESYLLC